MTGVKRKEEWNVMKASYFCKKFLIHKKRYGIIRVH